MFLIDQADWPRNALISFVVSATNSFGESDNSTSYEFLTPL